MTDSALRYIVLMKSVIMHHAGSHRDGIRDTATCSLTVIDS